MAKSHDNVIELEDFRVKDSKIFTGRDRGKSVRERSKIDDLITQYEKVVLVIPDEIYSINPSFLEEFLVNVVEKLGRDGFYRTFEIKNVGTYDFDRRLREAVESILRTRTGLD